MAMSKSRTMAVAVLLFALFLSTVFAAPTDTTPDVTVNVLAGKVTVPGSVVAIVLMVAGFFFAFFGHKFFKITLFLAGFYIFSTLAWIGLANAAPATGYGANSDWIYLGVSGGFGLIGGALFLCFWKLGFAAIGALAGFYFAIFLMSWSETGVITNAIGRTAFIIILCILGVVATFFLERHVIIIGTAIVGSGSFFIGLDNFVHTGYNVAMSKFLDGKHDVVYTLDGKVYAMLAGTLVMMIVGALFQYWKHKGSFIPKSHRSEHTNPKYQQV